MNDTTQKQRRQRAILSCNDCRRRKLKCDRLSPCNRCIKGGIADSCTYDSEAHSMPSYELLDRPVKKQRRHQSTTRFATIDEPRGSKSGQDVFKQTTNVQPCTVVDDQLEQLEHNVPRLQQPVPRQEHEVKDQVEFLASSPELKGVNCCTTVMGMLKGRSYGTHYYGPSSPMSIVAHFPELRAFMKEAYIDSTARRLSQDMKALEDQARSMRPHHRVFTVHRLRDLLPDKLTMDNLLQKYFESFETTFRIVHVPTFKAAYESYWETRPHEDGEMDALILAILACTLCTSTNRMPRYNHAGSTFHTKAVIWIKACEAWLKRQSNKRRSLVTLQVRSLRLLALATTSLKAKEYYQEVQAHIALLRSVGMHRDPSIFGTRVSAFEGELRRRLWATAIELESQASIDKGTCSMLSNSDYDCAPPRNIDDIELQPGMKSLPRSRKVTSYTDTAFLHASMQTFKLRTNICSKANSLKDTLEFHDILSFEDSIQKCLQDIPHWTSPKSTQAQTLLSLQLQQFLIILHASRTVKSQVRFKSDCRYSMMAALEAAEKTLDLHYNLIKESNYALVLTRNDYLRATLVIHHIAYYVKRADDVMMSRLAKLIYEESVEKSLRLQEERAMRPGRGSEYFWYVSAAVSLVGMQYDPSQSKVLQRQAVDRVAKLMYKMLSLQDDPSEETLATEVLLEYRPPNAAMNTNDTLPEVADYLTTDSFVAAGLQLDAFDFADTTDWMMGDFWFLNDPPLDLNG